MCVCAFVLLCARARILLRNISRLCMTYNMSTVRIATHRLNLREQISRCMGRCIYLYCSYTHDYEYELYKPICRKLLHLIQNQSAACVKANDRLYPVTDYDAETNRIKNNHTHTNLSKLFYVQYETTLKTTIKIDFISMRHETL